MRYVYIDMETYKRKAHFEYFNSLAYPYAGMTVNVDITALLEKVKREKLSFFLTFCYCAARAANGVREFRQRIVGGRIVEFEWCQTTHTVALDDETYAYCDVDSRIDDFEIYIKKAVTAQETAKCCPSIAEAADEALGKIFVSSVPWVTYTSLVQPVPMPADSNPRLTWGKYFEENGRILLPVSVLCHHALVDGVHMSKFYRLLEKEMEALTKSTAECVNILGHFCGKRDIETLTSSALQEKYGIAKADVMVLFGGSILAGGDVLAEAMKSDIASKYIIVGGEGHTTETLREKISNEFAGVNTSELAEAELFEYYLEKKYGVCADYLETESTNCGNNISLLLNLLEEEDISFKSIILCQDATMQQRMAAGLKKYVADDVLVINYAAYEAHVSENNGSLHFDDNIYGMWEMDRYINLLMGEIPRLTDNTDGYGPNGKNYIAHVDIPNTVVSAFEKLKKVYSDNIREANPLYASEAAAYIEKGEK